MISKRVSKLVPYTAGEQPRDKRYIKLNTNENPFPPSKAAEKVLLSYSAENLRLYPDPDSALLKRAIAAKESAGEQNVFVGNGSDEVLAFAFYALFDGGVLFPDITYSFYPVFCDLFGISYSTAPVDDGSFKIDKSDYIKNGAAGGIVLANPNAPTGVLLDGGAVREIVESNSCNVIIDEAYIDFASAAESSSALALANKNLQTVKTFSKSYSLAGIRCGYAVGDAALIAALERVKNSFNSYPLDRIAQSVCAAAVADVKYFDDCRAKVIKTRRKTADALKKLGFVMPESEANFLFVRHGGGKSGQSVYEYLRQNGILVRWWDKPRISDYVRITVGADSDMDTLIETLKKF